MKTVLYILSLMLLSSCTKTSEFNKQLTEPVLIKVEAVHNDESIITSNIVLVR